MDRRGRLTVGQVGEAAQPGTEAPSASSRAKIAVVTSVSGSARWRSDSTDATLMVYFRLYDLKVKVLLGLALAHPGCRTRLLWRCCIDRI